MSGRENRGFVEWCLNKIGYEKSGSTRAYHSYDDRTGKEQDVPVFVQTVNDDWHDKEGDHREKEKRYWRKSLFLGFCALFISGGAAVFAYLAYCAANGQLQAMIRDARPFVTISDKPEKPDFVFTSVSNGQTAWDFYFTNYGKDYARNVRFLTYIRIGNGKFKRSFGAPAEPSYAGDIPSGKNSFGTIVSPILSEEAYGNAIKVDGGIAVLIVFVYEDFAGREFTNKTCLSRLQSGTNANVNPAKCEENKVP